ncbi:hypothetical protein YC2023_114494 [Brassica napus]
MASSFSTREARDRKSSSRQDNRQSHQGIEVWSRLEILTRRGDAQRGPNYDPPSRNTHRKDAPRPNNNSTLEWRPRRNVEDSRNKSKINGAPHQTEYDRELAANRISEAAIANAEEERIRRLKGKAVDIDVPTTQTKATRSTPLEHRGTNLIISEQPSETPLPTRQAQRYDPSPMEQGGKFLELETGIDQDLMAPLTDLEIAEVDNLVLETERLEMAENEMAENTIDENMIDIDNDDLLGDSPDLDAEKIEAISQLSPANAEYKESASIGQHLALAKATATSQEPAQKNFSKKRGKREAKMKPEARIFKGESRDVYRIKSYTAQELDLNKAYYDEEELHPKKKMEPNVMDLLKIYLPKYF